MTKPEVKPQVAVPTRFRFKLCEADASYQRADEWFTFDLDAIDSDVSAAEQMAFESTMDFTFDEIAYGLRRGAVSARLASMWVARRLAGVQEHWAMFTPHVRAADLEFLDAPEQGDAGPPAPAAEPSAAEPDHTGPAASPTSSTS